MRHALAFLTAFLLASPGELRAVNLIDLRCEYHENPLGIDVAKPQLGWKIADGGQKPEGVTQKPRGLRQTAYQVLVASTPVLLAKDQGDLWDSGMVPSDRASTSHMLASRWRLASPCIGRCASRIRMGNFPDGASRRPGSWE